MDHTVIIKKYVNRRLYDTEKSVYVTLAQVSVGQQIASQTGGGAAGRGAALATGRLVY